MTPRERLLAQTKRHEAFRQFVYDDATGRALVPGSQMTGHPTVGYGLALDVRGLTERQATWILSDIYDELEHDLRLRVAHYDELDDVRRMALLELAYQMGVGGLLTFGRMLQALDDEDYDRVGAELLQSRWATQTGPTRVQTLHHMLTTGTWPA